MKVVPGFETAVFPYTTDIPFLSAWGQPVLFCFFFSSRRRHTSSYGDWSSDVCSSDLSGREPGSRPRDGRQRAPSRAATTPRGAGRASGTCDHVVANQHGTAVAESAGRWNRSEERRVGKERRAGGEQERRKEYNE